MSYTGSPRDTLSLDLYKLQKPTYARGPHAGNHTSTRLSIHEILRGSPDRCVMSVSCLVLRQLLGVYLWSEKESLSQS